MTNRYEEETMYTVYERDVEKLVEDSKTEKRGENPDTGVTRCY
jgi:hypothetical protein